MQRYVILEQIHAAALAFARKGEDRVTEVVTGDAAELRMPEIGITVPLAELYEGVDVLPPGMEPGSEAG